MEPLPTIAEIEALEATGQPPAPEIRTAPKKTSELKTPKRTGRPADPGSSLPRVFDSIAQCSAQCGIPVPALREAKKAGCVGFRHSRVDLVEFLKWRFGLSDDAVSDWGEKLKEYKGRREKIALDKDLGLVADRGEVTFAVGKAMATLFSNIDNQFGSLLPPILKGLDEAGIQQRLMATSETFKQAVREELKKFVDVDKPKPEIKS